MYAQVSLADRNGLVIAETNALIESATWRLNGVGMAKLWLAWSDDNCTQEKLAFGNVALIQFNNGLPLWGGVIDPPRRRVHGSVGITAYSGERLLDWRVTAKSRAFNSTPPGQIFQSLIEEENAEYPTGVEIGTIYAGGTGRSIEYHYHDLLRRIMDLTRLTGNEFAVLPELAAGRVSFKAHWYERRGQDKRNTTWFLDGRNVGEATMDEQGTLANQIWLAGSGSTWGSERLTADDASVASRDAYRYREYAEVQAGVTVQETLDANAAELLAQKAYPQNVFSISATNKAPGLFASYDVGDIVTAKLFQDSPEWAVSATVRVVAREVRSDGSCGLEVVEWTD